MSISRLILVLLSALSVMLAVVILRTERVRLQFQLAKIERACDEIDQDIRERQLELARIGNPTVLWERLRDLKGPDPAELPAKDQDKSKGKPATPAKPRKP